MQAVLEQLFCEDGTHPILEAIDGALSWPCQRSSMCKDLEREQRALGEVVHLKDHGRVTIPHPPPADKTNRTLSLLQLQCRGALETGGTWKRGNHDVLRLSDYDRESSGVDIADAWSILEGCPSLHQTAAQTGEVKHLSQAQQIPVMSNSGLAKQSAFAARSSLLHKKSCWLF